MSVANPAILTKLPGEIRQYSVSFAKRSELCEDGESLTGTPSVSVSPSGLNATAISISGAKVVFTLSGGAADETYSITVLVETSGGSTIGALVKLKVEDT